MQQILSLRKKVSENATKCIDKEKCGLYNEFHKRKRKRGDDNE